MTSYLAIITPREATMLTEAQIFKMAVARFFYASEGEINEMKENTVALIIIRVLILKQLFSSCRLSEYCGIIHNTPRYYSLIVKYD